MNTEPMLDRAYRLLDESAMTRAQIADGAGVGFHWLCKFKQRRVADPGVRQVERLIAFLENAASPTEVA